MISIIIPSYNRGNVLEKTLPSYLKQRHVKEIIVVDDGSIDNTRGLISEIARVDERIKYLRHDSKRGAPVAKNTGMQRATGKYILFGEDDVFLDDNYSSQLLECMKKNDADIIAGRLIYLITFKQKNEELERWNKIKMPLIDKSLIKGNFSIKTQNDIGTIFLHSCFLARAEVLDGLYYDENYQGNGYREETDIQVAAAKLGYKIFFCPHTACFHFPRQPTRGSGQHAINRFAYQYWTIKNNHYFLKKHYPFFKKELQLQAGILKLTGRLACHEIRSHLLPSIINDILRYIQPGTRKK